MGVGGKNRVNWFLKSRGCFLKYTDNFDISYVVVLIFSDVFRFSLNFFDFPRFNLTNPN